jgi:hypothetical protein
VAALNDQKLPESSGDKSIPRHTFWPHRGGREWLQYVFDEPRTVSAVAVYWFDDTGRGSCRTPKRWRLLYRNDDDDAWRPAAALNGFSVARDRLNRVEIDPVKASGLRLEVDLQPGFSAGVLEWTVP